MHSRPVTCPPAPGLTLKMVLAWNTYGTDDVRRWEVSAERFAAGDGLDMYKYGSSFELSDGQFISQVYNRPPPVLYLLRVWRATSHSTGIPMGFWLRSTDAVAD